VWWPFDETSPVNDDPVAEDLQDAGAMWAVDRLSVEEIIDLAVDLLMAGVDTESLRVLAGVPKRDASIEVPDLLESTLGELGLAFFEPGSTTAKNAAAGVMARYVQVGALAPRAFVEWMHDAFGHVDAGDLEIFSSLADGYDIHIETESDIDRRVLAAVDHLLASAD
jgi:hypothetical protein